MTLNNTQKYHAGFVQCFACNILGCSYWVAIIEVNPKQITQPTSQQHFNDGMIIYFNSFFHKENAMSIIYLKYMYCVFCFYEF